MHARTPSHARARACMGCRYKYGSWHPSVKKLAATRGKKLAATRGKKLAATRGARFTALVPKKKPVDTVHSYDTLINTIITAVVLL